MHETIAAKVEAERQRRIEEVRKETIANAIATVKARLEAEAAARQQIDAPGKTRTLTVNIFADHLTPSESLRHSLRIGARKPALISGSYMFTHV